MNSGLILFSWSRSSRSWVSLLILLLKPAWKNAIRWTALLTALVTFGLSSGCSPSSTLPDGDMQFEYLLPWFTLGGNPIGVPLRRGRHQHPDGAAHHLPHPTCHPFHLESG